jgi:hypothetical protein
VRVRTHGCSAGSPQAGSVDFMLTGLSSLHVWIRNWIGLMGRPKNGGL